jgi:hypothetical protein
MDKAHYFDKDTEEAVLAELNAAAAAKNL